MKVSDVLAPDVAPQVRFRGEQYFQEGRVNIILAKPGKVFATVHGSRKYDVDVAASGRELDYYCSCPYGNEGEICKHVWATVLAAEEDGYLGSRPKHSAWQHQLDLIQALPARRDPWPERRQILYFVEPQASAVAGGVVVALYMRDRKAKGEGWNQRKELKLDRNEIYTLHDAADRDILSLISGGADYSPWSVGGSGV